MGKPFPAANPEETAQTASQHYQHIVSKPVRVEPTLLNLPPELRLMIFEYTMISDVILVTRTIPSRGVLSLSATMPSWISLHHNLNVWLSLQM